MLWCLHGFLGEGADWDRFDFALPHQAPSLFSHPFPSVSFDDWAASFVRLVAREDDAPILLGYSLGGRLGLHLLLAAPHLWRAAIFVSTNAGLTSAVEREVRRKLDQQWAERFLHDDWKEVVAAWEAQPLFGGREGLARREGDYSREALAAGLSGWSLGNQRPLLPELTELDLPLLWIVGEQDARALQQARGVASALPHAELALFPDAFHRVPWEKPRQFQKTVNRFLKEINRGWTVEPASIL